MIKIPVRAIQKSQLPSPGIQDQAACLHPAGGGEFFELTLEEEADLIEAQAEMARGEFATKAEVQAVLAKFQL